LKSIIENYEIKDDGIIKEATELKTSIEGQRHEEMQNKSQEDPEKDL